jgi:hypothetical protein
MLTEGILLALLGAVLGLFIAFPTVKLLIGIDPGMIPGSDEIGFDLRILGFAVLLAFMNGLLFSVLPALRASKPDLTESLKERGHRSATPFGGRHAHGILVIVEIALSNEDPIGKVLNLGLLDMPVGGEPPLQIVGVVADVSPNPFQRPLPVVYMPYSQSPQTFHQFHSLPRATVSFVARTEVAPAGLKTAMQHVASDVAGDAIVLNIQTVEEMKSQFLQRLRMYTRLLAVFAGIAVTLAAVGIFEVMSYAVTRRTREIGIRMALGSRQRTVIRLIMKQGLLMILCGLIVALAGAFGLTRFLRGLLFEVKPTDSWAFVVVSIVLCIVALIARFLPARCAANMDPASALRTEWAEFKKYG